jgi:hypothetical protein
MVLVVVLSEVQQNGRGFEDREVPLGVVHNGGDSAVRVELNEPRLLLCVLGNVDLREAKGSR